MDIAILSSVTVPRLSMTRLLAAIRLFTGYLVAKAGEIKLLRESFNPLTMAQAQLPNGVADIGPPDDQAHPFRSSARRVQIRQCGLGR
jgi:hypothetical protein